MTKSDVYFGRAQEIEIVESLTKTPPVMSAQKTDTIVHNTNVSLVLSNTSKILDVSQWVEAPDFLLKVYPLSRGNKAYLDNGGVTQTEYLSGKRVTAGYTTGVIDSTLTTTVVFAASGYNCVEKVVLFPHKQGLYYVDLGFVDIGGVSHALTQYIKPDARPFVINLARYKVDRTISMSLTICFHSTTSTKGLEANAVVGSNIISGFMFDPVDCQICCFNSLDTDPITINRATSNSFDTLVSYIKRYSAFISQHPIPFSVPLDLWIDVLARGIDYAIAQGWATLSQYNNLSEIRDVSLRLVGMYSKIIAGDFSDPSIPTHFGKQIENMLQSDGTLLSNVLLYAAIWALCDDIVLEVSN